MLVLMKMLLLVQHLRTRKIGGRSCEIWWCPIVLVKKMPAIAEDQEEESDYEPPVDAIITYDEAIKSKWSSSIERVKNSYQTICSR